MKFLDYLLLLLLLYFITLVLFELNIDFPNSIGFTLAV